MTEIPQQTFTFNVGGEPVTDSLLKIGGSMRTHRELNKGEEVHVQVVDADGVVVADAYGRVIDVGFRDKIDEQGHVTATTRTQTAKVS